MFGSYELMSGVIGAVGFTFALVLIPTLLNKHARISRSSSGLTCAGLLVIGLCMANMSLWVAALSEFVSTAMWFALFVWRHT